MSSKGIVKLPGNKPTPPHLVRAEAKGQRLVKTLVEAVENLTIESDEDYAGADELLGNISRARQAWSGEIETVLAPLRLAKSAADALNRKIDRPMLDAETTVKAVMAAYDRKKLEAKRLIEEQQRQEQARIQRQLEEAAAKEAAAKTEPMRRKLATKRETLEQQLEESAEQGQQLVEEAAPVQALNSQRRAVKTWRCANLEAAIIGVTNGVIPADVLKLDTARVLAYFRENPETVASWPGFVVEEDIQIARRG